MYLIFFSSLIVPGLSTYYNFPTTNSTWTELTSSGTTKWSARNGWILSDLSWFILFKMKFPFIIIEQHKPLAFLKERYGLPEVDLIHMFCIISSTVLETPMCGILRKEVWIELWMINWRVNILVLDVWTQATSLSGDFYAQNNDAVQPGPVAPWYGRYGHTLTAIDMNRDGKDDAMILIGGFAPTPMNDIWVTTNGITWS